MKREILGESKKSNFDDNLADYVNGIFDKMPDELEKPVVENTNSSELVYDLDYFLQLDIEQFPPASSDDQDGADRFSFTESHKRIVRDGYERHLSFQEQVALSILSEEGKLPEDLTAIADCIFSDYSVWTNQAYELLYVVGRGKVLKIYAEVTKLDYDGNNYDSFSLESSGKTHIFPIEELYLGSNSLKLVQKYYPDLVEFFFTRKFENLPEYIIEDSDIFIPKEPGKIIPLARGTSNGLFNVSGIPELTEEEAESRGVRKRINKFQEVAQQLRSGELIVPKTNDSTGGK